MSKDAWNAQHIKYSEADWIKAPTIFSETAIKHFPKSGRVLDLGCGQGQDSRYFAANGYEVTGMDFSDEGIRFAESRSDNKHSNLIYKKADISERLPFDDSTFDVVYSHLAVHYFDKEKTKEIFSEISRVLKRGGVLALLVNSVNDPEYGAGEKIEEDYYLIKDMKKRYFSKDSILGYTKGFETILCDENGETFKDRAKSVSNLVRYIGMKP